MNAQSRDGWTRGWQVYKIIQTNSVWYPYHIEGWNRWTQSTFSWSVPSLVGCEYDLSYIEEY
jgi:hypothetical protein